MKILKAIFAMLLVPFGIIPDCNGAVRTEYSRQNTEVSEYKVTAYCPCRKCCGKWADIKPRRTASGHLIKKGDRFCAGPADLRFGTLAIIPGYNDNQPVKVLDRGPDITGNSLDVFFPTHKEAKRWGVKYLKVKIGKT